MQNSSESKLDVVTLGHIETLLVGEQIGADLGQMQSYQQYPGGFAVNLSIACARLKLNCSLVGRVGQDQLGRQCVDVLKHNFVDTEHVQELANTQSVSCQLAIAKDGSISRHTNPASMALALNEQDIYPEWLNQSHALVVSAQQFIHNQRAIRKAIVAAREAKVAVFLAFDFPRSYKPNAETLEQFQQTLPGLLPLIDVLIGTQAEFLNLTGAMNLYDALKEIRSFSDAKFICILEQGASFWVDKTIPTDWQDVPNHPGFDLKVQNPLASIEGFIAGFLYAWRQEMSTESALLHANAAMSLTASRSGGYQDLPSLKELKTYISAYQQEHQQLNAHSFNHLHYASCRNKPTLAWPIVGFEFTSDNDELKTLIQEALPIAAKQSDLTPLYIAQVQSLHYAQDSLVAWKKPLEETGANIAQTLLPWPQNERLCCKVVTHPDDHYANRMAQENVLLQVVHACESKQRELIIQIEYSKNQHVTSKTLAQLIERYLSVGIYADWWLLPIPRDERPYPHLEQVIEQFDPHCRGILLQCPYNKLEQMAAAFDFAKNTSWCKGFVVSENSFADIIKQWQNNEIANHILVDMIAKFYEQSCAYWHKVFVKEDVLVNETEVVG